MPAAPLPTPSAPAFSVEKRTAIAAALGLICLGVIIGFKVAGGVEAAIPQTVERVVFRSTPCAKCEEQNQPQPQHAVPGDSSIPED